MGSAIDARFVRSEERIQDALAALLKKKGLAQIGVSELAREANVSRATFYAHYDNVHEAYEQLVGRAMERVQSFDEHFACSQCSGKAQNLPYCERIRTEGELEGVLKDPSFFSVMMEQMTESGSSSLENRLRERGVARDVAGALMLFQMSGCHAVALSPFAERTDWHRIRTAIDRFIEGGLAAVGNGL